LSLCPHLRMPDLIGKRKSLNFAASKQLKND